ncbi:methyltransferase family protein [Salipaludibacillus keqinensis]|uniref:methyltransferase family protein n=1 Tax=Salipaludibacillus keqinensis TaxID=2045207 RepID=UPI0013048B22|nr:isoprenylcysteine carboxylmethyltransferase family protein [Salipaludibacillus keqinensis]
MAIIDILFIIITIVWLGEFVFFKNRRVKDKKSTDTSTFPGILLSVLAVITASVFSRELAFLTFNSQLLLWTGIIFYAVGVILRYWGMLKLGKQFTRDVNVTGDDEIIGTGPFRVLRHPLYTGLLSALVGISFYTGSMIGLFLTFFLFMPFLLKRIRLEEEMLVASFGKDYEKWAETRNKLIPFIY